MAFPLAEQAPSNTSFPLFALLSSQASACWFFSKYHHPFRKHFTHNSWGLVILQTPSTSGLKFCRGFQERLDSIFAEFTISPQCLQNFLTVTTPCSADHLVNTLLAWNWCPIDTGIFWEQRGTLLLQGTSKLALEILRDYNDSLEKIHLMSSLIFSLTWGSKDIQILLGDCDLKTSNPFILHQMGTLIYLILESNDDGAYPGVASITWDHAKTMGMTSHRTRLLSSSSLTTHSPEIHSPEGPFSLCWLPPPLEGKNRMSLAQHLTQGLKQLLMNHKYSQSVFVEWNLGTIIREWKLTVAFGIWENKAKWLKN